MNAKFYSNNYNYLLIYAYKYFILWDVSDNKKIR